MPTSGVNGTVSATTQPPTTTNGRTKPDGLIDLDFGIPQITVPSKNGRLGAKSFYLQQDTPIPSRSHSPGPFSPEPATSHFPINGDYKSPLPYSASEVKAVPSDGPGTLPNEIYDSSMAPWRAAIRRKIVSGLQKESELLAAMQVCTVKRFERRAGLSVSFRNA